MWEAGSRLQLTRLACTGAVLERAGALQGMRSCLRDLVLTIQDGRWCVWGVGGGGGVTAGLRGKMQQISTQDCCAMRC
jgi:hypothetical protein